MPLRHARLKLAPCKVRDGNAREKEMEAAAKNLDFIKAAKLRDEIAALKA